MGSLAKVCSEKTALWMSLLPEWPLHLASGLWVGLR